MDELLDAISDASPKFNEYLLVDYPQGQIESAPEFIDQTWRDAIKLVGGAFSYIGYEVLTPEKRAKYEMSGKNSRTIAGNTSELLLIKCMFEHEKEIHENYFYTPYFKDWTLFIRGRRMSLVLGICERVFARMIEKNRDGIMIRPIRTPVRFNRTEPYRVTSASSDLQYRDWIVVGYLHNKLTSKRSVETTVIHYLLCKFGFDYVVQRLGIRLEDIGFVDKINHEDLSDYEYFDARKITKKSIDMIYLKVRKTVLDDKVARKFIANLLYTITHFDFQTIQDLREPDGSAYRIMLGKVIRPSASYMQARNDADTHIASVDLFLDPITLRRFNEFIPNLADDIYDILFYVFVHIDSLMVNSSAQNLYDKRVDVSVGILVEAYAKAIYQRIYRSNQKTVLRKKEVTSLLKNRPMAIDSAINSTKKNGARNINPAPTISNDSWLSSCGAFKARHDGNPKQRFDPSMAYGESIVAFAGKNIGMSGLINPMMVIDPNGGIERQPYCDDIDSLRDFLPK